MNLSIPFSIPFIKPAGPKGINRRLQDLVSTSLKIPVNETGHLLVVEKRGHFAGRRVKRIRAFDPQRVSGRVDRINYDTLRSHASAVVFEGHTEQNGSVMIYDRRAASVPATT